MALYSARICLCFSCPRQGKRSQFRAAYSPFRRGKLKKLRRVSPNFPFFSFPAPGKEKPISRRIFPFPQGKIKKAPPRLPEFFGTGRDGAATLRVSPAQHRALECIRTQRRVSETNGQGNSPQPGEQVSGTSARPPSRSLKA